MKHVVFFLLAACLATVARAHGGEDHDHEVAPALSGRSAPRASAQSEAFELVAVLAGGTLTLYLDRSADNAPVADAVLEVESGTFRAAATPVAPGVYALPGEAFARPGRYPLTIAVQARESADLLTATLELTPPAAGVAPAPGGGTWTLWGVAVGGLLVVAGGLAVLRRRRH